MSREEIEGKVMDRSNEDGYSVLQGLLREGVRKIWIDCLDLEFQVSARPTNKITAHSRIN